MVVKAKKWGNSLAIKIPMFVAKELGIKDSTQVNLKIDGNKIIISLIKKRKNII